MRWILAEQSKETRQCQSAGLPMAGPTAHATKTKIAGCDGKELVQHNQSKGTSRMNKDDE